MLALSSGENSLRYVFASEAGERGATLSSWGFEERGHQSREAFMRKIKSRLPQGGRAVLVLDPEEYQLIPLEAPGVPAEELRQALRWKAMEFLGGSPHDYTLDVLSVASAGEAPGRVIAVAAHNDVVRRHMLECERLGLELAVVDVGETALRNLLHAALLAESSPQKVAAALVTDAGKALVIIEVEGQLYFFRRFEFNADLLALPALEAQPAMVGEGAVAESATRSLTQLQRSLDLWDDSYPHLPLGTLRVHAAARTEAIVERIAPEAGVETRSLALDGVFKLPPGTRAPPWNDSGYLPLLGALLRPAEARP